jgi:hypothetical protein
MSFTQRVSIPENIMFRELEGESVILDLDSESYFGLDLVGTRIWQLLVDGDSIQAAYDLLLEEFDVDAATLRADLEELLDELATKGLIEIHRDAP